MGQFWATALDAVMTIVSAIGHLVNKIHYQKFVDTVLNWSSIYWLYTVCTAVMEKNDYVQASVPSELDKFGYKVLNIITIWEHR